MSALFGRIELASNQLDPSRIKNAIGYLNIDPNDGSNFVSGDDFVFAGRPDIHSSLSNTVSIYRSSDGEITVADAILDNREDIGRALGIQRNQVASMSNAQLIHQTIERWGKSGIKRLYGAFSFAFFVPKTGELLLARDHVGLRPLYWSHQNGTVVFSTSIAALVRCDDLKWTIDETMIAEFLSDDGTPVTKPFFTQILQVRPGCYCSYRNDRMHRTRWWNPPTSPRNKTANEDQALEQAKRLLEQSVSKCILSQQPIGSHFSGGVDSTCITVIAARQLQTQGRNLHAAYTWAPKIDDCFPVEHVDDERLRMNKIAEHECFPIAFGNADSRAYFELIKRPMELANQTDLADELSVLKAAKQDKVGVILSGWGGDEVFSSKGSGYVFQLLIRGKFSKALRLINFGNSLKQRVSVAARVTWREVVFPLIPNTLLNLLARSQYSKTNAYSLISTELKNAHPRALQNRKNKLKAGVNPSKTQFDYLSFGHIEMRIEGWHAWATPLGIRYNFPLLDREFLEFLLTLHPEEMHFGNRPRGLALALFSEYSNERVIKLDPANEKLRETARYDTWCEIADAVARGEYEDDCPWIDKEEFLRRASEPRTQSELQNILLFMSVLSAARVWQLFRRAKAGGWLSDTSLSD